MSHLYHAEQTGVQTDRNVKVAEEHLERSHRKAVNSGGREHAETLRAGTRNVRVGTLGS